MAFPVLEKTWQFALNGYGSTKSSTLWQVKNVLKAFAISPWTVWGSGNTVSVSNGGGVDYWTTSGNLIYSSTNYSWIVLQQAGLGAKTSILLATTSPNNPYGTVYLSPKNGFGAMNGGSDGTAGTAPSATDAIGLPFNGSGMFWDGANYFHAMQSTDGQCTRVFSFVSGVMQSMWFFDRPKNPVSVMTDSVVAAAFTLTSAGEVLTYFEESATYFLPRTRVTSGSYTQGALTSEGYYSSSTKLGTLTYADDQSAEWPLCPIGVTFFTALHRGRKCELYDMWRCGAPRGTPLPDNGSRTLMSLGGLAVPWDGVSNLVWQ